MKPRRAFLGDPGNLGEGEEPAALLLEGAGGVLVGGRGVSRPRSSPASSTQALRAQSPQLRGHSSPRGISLGKRHPHHPLAKSWQAEQVPSSPSPAPTLGGGLSHRRINGTGTKLAIIFQGLGFPWDCSQGCRPDGGLCGVN